MEKRLLSLHPNKFISADSPNRLTRDEKYRGLTKKLWMAAGVAALVAAKIYSLDNTETNTDNYDESIALVPVGVDSYTAADVANATENDLERVTTGVITADVEVVELSEGVTEKLAAEKCLDPLMDTLHGAAEIDNLLDEGAYDKVLFLVDKPECGGQAMGRAMPVTGVAATYGAYDYDDADQTQMNMPYWVDGSGNGIPTGVRNEQAKDITLHELLHLYNLGHMSELNFNYDEAYKAANEEQMAADGVGIPPRTMDINYMAKYGIHSEYYDSHNDMMGSTEPDNIPADELRPVQLRTLAEPLEVAGQPLSPEVARISVETLSAKQPEISIGSSESSYPDIISVPLPEGGSVVDVVDSNGNTKSITFSSLEIEMEYASGSNPDQQGLIRAFIYGKTDYNQFVRFDIFIPYLCEGEKEGGTDDCTRNRYTIGDTSILFDIDDKTGAGKIILETN